MVEAIWSPSASFALYPFGYLLLYSGHGRGKLPSLETKLAEKGDRKGVEGKPLEGLSY